MPAKVSICPAISPATLIAQPLTSGAVLQKIRLLELIKVA